MLIGSGNYVYRGGKGLKARSKMSKVWTVRHSGLGRGSTGCIDIHSIHFPKHCVGKRVRVRIEFIDEPNMIMDKNGNLTEVLKWEGE
jgi:hypothetical protein